MAGIVLLKARTGRAGLLKSKKEQLAAFIEQHMPSTFSGIDYHTPDDSTLLIHFRKHDRPSFWRDEQGNWLGFSGVVFDLRQVHHYSAGELWELYRREGTDMASRLDGHFVIKLHDAAGGQTHVISDFMKNKINFICETDDFIMFTPFLALTAAIRAPRVDRYAFNEFMWRYYIMSGRSMLEGVQRIEPGTVYHLQNDTLRRERYWTVPKFYTGETFERSLERLTESIMQSARLVNRVDPKPLIEFTMGQDSRTLLSAFTRQQLPFETAIFGKDDFLEVRKVREMAARHHFKLHHITLAEDYLRDPWGHVKPSILLGSAEEPAYLMGRIRHMRQQYRPFASTVVNGVHGRFYKDGTWNEMYVMNAYREPRRFRSDIFIRYRALNKNYDDAVFNEAFRRLKADTPRYLEEMIRHAVKGYEQSPVAVQVDVFDLFHYANFGYVANNICNLDMDVLSPLLFRRNLDIALTLPAKWRYNLSRIQRAVVHNLDPSLAAEKTDFGGLDMVPRSGAAHAAFVARYWYAQSAKFRDKLKNLLGFNVTTQLQKAWDYKPVYQRMFEQAREEGLFEYGRMELGLIIEQEPWREMLGRYEDPAYHSLERLEYILKIATVEQFLRDCRELARGGT